MSSFFDKIKEELFVGDPTKSESGTTPSSVLPITSLQPPLPASIYPPIQNPTVPAVGDVVIYSSGSSTIIDPDALKLIRDSVMTESVDGRPSEYIKFLKIWDAINRPSDISTVINVLKITDPTVTVETIGNDLRIHISLLDKTVQEAESQINSTAQSSLAEIENKISALQKQDDVAKSEISRHQAEIASRST